MYSVYLLNTYCVNISLALGRLPDLPGGSRHFSCPEPGLPAGEQRRPRRPTSQRRMGPPTATEHVGKSPGREGPRPPTGSHRPGLSERANPGPPSTGSRAGRRRSPPSEGPRLPVGRVLEVEDGPVGASAEVHRVRGMDGTVEVGHGAEIVPRRVHEHSAAQAALPQPPEQPGTRAAQAGADPAVRPSSPARRGGLGRLSLGGSRGGLQGSRRPGLAGARGGRGRRGAAGVARAPGGRQGRGCVSPGRRRRRQEWGRERPDGYRLLPEGGWLLSPGSGHTVPSGATGPAGKHDQRPRPRLRAAAPPAYSSALPLPPPLPARAGLTPPAGKPAPPLGRRSPGTAIAGAQHRPTAAGRQRLGVLGWMGPLASGHRGRRSVCRCQ